MLEIFGLSSDTKPKPTKSSTPSSAPKKVLKITKLTSGVRDPNRINIFINDKFAFSLDTQQIIDLQIKTNLILTPEKLNSLRQASEFGKLYQRTLEWVLVRPRSVKETRDYLKRRQLKRNQLNYKRAQDQLKSLPELDDNLITLVIDRLAEKKYIDDHRFAEFFIENRLTKKGASTKRLKSELRLRGVSENIIDEVFANTERNEQDELKKMIIKKRQKYPDDQKLIAYLVRQGFSYQLVRDVVSGSKADF